MIRVDGPWFKDEFGRFLILRGVNLGGSSKVPFRPDGSTHSRDSFYDHRNVSFVGRPFPLHEADEHFARLRAWGLTFLRMLVTWEAIEHAGPGLYDEEYLDYLQRIVQKAAEYGLQLFLDPHQDVWSRLSGGDGAPGWTFEAVGLDMTRFTETGAAIVHAIHGDPFPRMIWPTNYSKLAAATMFTLFFGGNDFAPLTKVGGEPAQEFLQRHYTNAMVQVALRLKDLPNVVGYDTMNEPSPGFIGWADLNSGGALRLGECPTPFQAMLLGAGFPQEVGLWDMALTGPRLRGRRVLNPAGLRVWREGYDCLWRENGVWDLAPDGKPRLLRADHFSQVAGRRVDFVEQYLRPFLRRYIGELRSVHPQATIFLEGIPGEAFPSWGPADPPNVVSAAHWYDGLTLFTKSFSPYLTVDFHTRKLVLGPWRVNRSFVQQLARIKAEALQKMGAIPTLIGEVGIPFDMKGKISYRTGDFPLQERALDASLKALEANLLSYTLWNYTADNDNVHGDQWNGEVLSIFSPDQRSDPTDINSGGRALRSLLRPCARAVAGEPLRMSFDSKRSVFTLEFRHDPSIQAPTEIFVPGYHYGQGLQVLVTDGEYQLDLDQQELVYRHSTERSLHQIILRK